MDFELNETQRMIHQTMREFADREVKPRAAEIDRTAEFPWETVRKMADLNLFGMQIPAAYGGAELDAISYCIAIEEISRACMATATVICGHNSIAAWPIIAYGTEAQKQKYLPRMAKGEWLGAYALTEAGSGSDPGSMTTTAVRQGDEFILNGTKTFITLGSVAKVFVVFAKTDPKAGNKGITAFIVEPGFAGFAVGSKEDKMGIRASDTVGIHFNDMRVPAGNQLGPAGEGFKIAMGGLDGGRIGIAAQAIGCAQAAMDEALDYAKTRQQFGQPIGRFQAIQWKLAGMATEIQAARLMTWYAASLKQRGDGRYTKESAMAKLFASEMAVRCVNEAVQVFGGYGYMKDYTVERLYRDVRIVTLYEGTSEIQHLVIARQMGL